MESVKNLNDRQVLQIQIDCGYWIEFFPYFKSVQTRDLYFLRKYPKSVTLSSWQSRQPRFSNPESCFTLATAESTKSAKFYVCLIWSSEGRSFGIHGKSKRCILESHGNSVSVSIEKCNDRQLSGPKCFLPSCSLENLNEILASLVVTSRDPHFVAGLTTERHPFDDMTSYHQTIKRCKSLTGKQTGNRHTHNVSQI